MAFTTKVSPVNFPGVFGVNGQQLMATSAMGTRWSDRRLPSGYIHGMGISDTSVTQREIATGYARSGNDSRNITISAPITVDISASGANGLDTGTEAVSTWYYIYVIVDDDDVLPIAGLFSLSPTTPTLPVGYGGFRRLGAARNDGTGDFLNDRMLSFGRNRLVAWNEEDSALQVLMGGAALTWTTIDLSEFVPPTATGVKLLTVVQGSSSSRIFDEFRTGGNLSATTTMRTYAGNFSSSSIFTMGVIAQAIEYQGNDAGNALEVRVVGYVHPV